MFISYTSEGIFLGCYNSVYQHTVERWLFILRSIGSMSLVWWSIILWTFVEGLHHSTVLVGTSEYIKRDSLMRIWSLIFSLNIYLYAIDSHREIFLHTTANLPRQLLFKLRKALLSRDTAVSITPLSLISAVLSTSLSQVNVTSVDVLTSKDWNFFWRYN